MNQLLGVHNTPLGTPQAGLTVLAPHGAAKCGADCPRPSADLSDGLAIITGLLNTVHIVRGTVCGAPFHGSLPH